jgi:hypothetical protein
LGVPLFIHKLSKVELQPLVDTIADRLLKWKGRLMSHAGCTTLTKVTLLAIPIQVSIAVLVALGIYRAINKIWRAFIWNGSDHVQGANVWCRGCVTGPVELGGLSVSDLATMGYALMLRWEWLACTGLGQLWVALPSREERIVHVMFKASVIVVMGNRLNALSWID